MTARLFLVLSTLLSSAALPAFGMDPTTRPITPSKGEVGDLLRKWFAEGAAAGNIGDWYDNRDRGHSELNLTPYPQIQKHQYTEEELRTRRDWAAQLTILPKVVFGNSSTSAGISNGGSNVRFYYTHPMGLPFLYTEYTHNNVYMYPEHCDHRPGHNGTPNHGDVYPTNTPFVITSQGSSGSDQPFMHAVPYTLAAFRPDVKKKLVETGLLMPTLQMILRSSMKNITDPKQYLTGIAHPSVFEGKNVDDLKMVKMAHEITLDNIPPMVQLKVVEEDGATIGRDYFEANGGEKYPEAGVVVGRLFRATTFTRRIVVSAEASTDVNKHPLTYTWVILQGDEKKIKITPKNDAKSVAEIVVQYHDRRPIQPGSALESNRVEIGVFVNNGTYYSAPGFITYFGFDSEARTYDDAGRLLEVGYAMGDPSLAVANWPAMFELLQADPAAPGAKLIKSRFTEKELEILKKAGEEYTTVNAAVTSTDQKQKDAQAAVAKADKDAKPKADEALKAANQAHQAAVKNADEVLTKSRDGLKQPVKPLVESALNDLAAIPTFYQDHAEEIVSGADKTQKAVIANGRKRLIGLGVIADRPGDKIELSPIRPGSTPAAERLTRYEKAQLQRFNSEVIAAFYFKGVANAVWRENYVDPRLTAAKNWRDVYHYDEKGNRTGWTRYDGQKPGEFTPEGYLIVERDANGQPVRIQTMTYDRQKTAPFALKPVPSDQPMSYPLGVN